MSSNKLKEYERVARSCSDRGAIYATGIARTEAQAVVSLHQQLDSGGRERLLSMGVREAATTATKLTKK